jgi:chorismate mutase
MDQAALERLRQRIDAVDAKIVDLIAERDSLVEEARRLKAKHDVPLYDPAREAIILDDRAAWANARGLSEDAVRDVFRAILALSRGPIPAP